MWTIVPFTPSPFVVVKITEKLPNSSERARGLAHVRQRRGARPRHPFQVERVDEQARIADLPAPAAAHEPPQLLLHRPALPRGLLLKRPERAQIALGLDHSLDRGGAVRADQL